MAITLKKKTTMQPIIKTNPNGTKEHSDDLIQYEVMYFNNRKAYFLIATPCTKNNGLLSFLIDFKSRDAKLMQVTRQSSKARMQCEQFLMQNVDQLHQAYLANGVNGMREAVRDLFH